MYSIRKRIVIIAFIGIMAAAISIMTRPRVPESCQAFQDEVKQSVLSDSGLSGIIAVVEESTLEAVIAEHYQGMAAGDCTQALGPLKAQEAAMSATAWGPHMRLAGEEGTAASLQCRDKRLQGEIKTHLEAAQCANPAITSAISKAGYPYPDLLKQFTDKRMQEAAKVDKSLTGGGEDETEFAKFALAINEEERKRALGKDEKGK